MGTRFVFLGIQTYKSLTFTQKVDAKMLPIIKEAVRKKLEKEYEQTILLKNQVEKKLAEISVQKSRCVDLLIEKTIDKEIYDRKMFEIANEEVRLNEELASYTLINSEIDKIVDSVIDFLGNSAFYFESSDICEKRAILKMLSPNSFLNGKSAVFSIAKPFDFLLNNDDCEEWWVIRDSNPRPPRCKRDALAN